MEKKDLANAFKEVALLLELQGGDPHKIRTYQNASLTIERFRGDIKALLSARRLKQLKGIGDTLEANIVEFADRGCIGLLDELRAQFPDSLHGLFCVSGLGPKRVKLLYQKLGIGSIEQLEEACHKGVLADLESFGPRLQAKFLDGIEYAKANQGLRLLNRAHEAARELFAWLRQDPSVIRIDVAGSLRRGRELIKDVQVIASTRAPEQLMDRFTCMPELREVTEHGQTKSSVMMPGGIPAQLRVVADRQFPYALVRFTGNGEHNATLQKRAEERGLKLNEYGLFKDGNTLVPCADEAALYHALGLPLIPPELRENRGEFDAAALPHLVTTADLKGVIHCHTGYSDGVNSIIELMSGVQNKGYQYLVISDHSQSARYAGGMPPEHVLEQHREIDLINSTLEDFRVIKGVESDILRDGSLDYEEDLLKRFELVIVSIHHHLDMTEAEATKRVITAIENPYTDVLGHPTGRLLLSRKGYPLNMPKVLDACAANHVAIEINCNCRRLDLDWRYLRAAKMRGIKLAICPDAHEIDRVDYVPYGVIMARKGWLEPADLLNCMSARELLAWRAER